MRRGLRWKLLLLGLLTAVGVVLLIPWGWMAEDDGPLRNVVEALGWLAALGTPLAALLGAAWRRFDGASFQDASAAENVWEGRALYLVNGRPPEVSEVGLMALGVKPAIDTDSDADLPAFVPRDRDEKLERAISQGGMVLLHGRAAAGKSRAGAEALRRLRPHDPLVVPCDGTALRELVDHGADFAHTVVWLDDLERFLTPEGLDLGVLHRLSPGDRRTVVVATIRDEELARYDHASTSSTDEYFGIAGNAVELIEQLRDRRRVHLRDRLSDAEQVRAAERTDHRIHAALHAEEGFGEYLAAGRAMLGRWSTGGGDRFHVGQAVICAAVDCRRAGYHQALPTTVLDELHRHFLAPGWRHRADLPPVTDGIRWACERVLGASSCLLPRAGSTFLAADYLVDSVAHADTPLSGMAVTPETWRAVLALATPHEAHDIGLAAYEAGNLSVADDALRAAAANGSPIAGTSLGSLLAERGNKAEAETWYRAAANAGHEPAMISLSLLLVERGERAEAEAWYRRVAEGDREPVVSKLGDLLVEREGDTEL